LCQKKVTHPGRRGVTQPQRRKSGALLLWAPDTVYDRGPMAQVPAALIVFNTCPDEASAKRIAMALVDEGLAACVNALPQVTSIYRWRGKTETAAEWLLLIKCRADAYAAVEQRVRALHPYELPEVLAVPLANGEAAYLAWLQNPEK